MQTLLSYNKKILAWGSFLMLLVASVLFMTATIALPYGAYADDQQAREDLVAQDGEPFNPFEEGHIVIANDESSALVTVTNISETNAYTIHMASYEIYDAAGSPDFITSQKLFDSRTRSIGPGETITFGPDLPPCNYQVDFFEGPNVPTEDPDFGAEPLASTHTLLDWVVETGIVLCGGSEPEDEATLILEKRVVNNDDGTAIPGDFTLWFYDVDEGIGSRIETTTLVSHTVSPGTYQVGEMQLPGYQVAGGGWFADCTANGRVTLADGEIKRCVIVNNDVPTPDPEPELVIEKSGPEEVRPGGVITYSVAVTNTGEVSIPAGEYRITDRVEPPLTFLSAEPNCVFQPNQGGSRGRVVCTGDMDLDPGDTKVFELTFRVDAGASCGAEFSNKADLKRKVSSGWIPVDWDMQNSTIVCGTPGEPQLEIEKNGPSTVRPGQVATYTLTVTNVGTKTVPEYTVTDIIPQPLTFLRGTPNCTLSGAVVTCGSPSELKPSESETFTIVFRVDREGDLSQCPLTYTNTGEVDSPVTDPVTDSVDTTIVCGTDEEATLVLIKEVVNDDGGTLGVNDFPLFIDDTQVRSGQVSTMPSGTYTASEENQEGYTAGLWSGDCAPDGTVTLLPGDHKECVIVNDDAPGSCPLPDITLPNGGMLTTRIGQVVNYTFSVSGRTPIAVTISGNLPDGLTFDENTLTISGTPTAVTDTDGVTVVIRAENECGETSAPLTIIVVDVGQCIPPVFEQPGPNTDISTKVNEPFSYEIEFTHGNPVDVFVSGLPSGLSFDENTNTIEGTPTQTGSFGITITLAESDDPECRAVREMVITITGGGGGCTTCGGVNPPDVVLFANATNTPLASASFVFLSQVPYTGLGLDILQAILFLLGLLVISGIAAYGALRSGGSLAARVRAFAARLKGAFVQAYTTPVKETVHSDSVPEKTETAEETSPGSDTFYEEYQRMVKTQKDSDIKKENPSKEMALPNIAPAAVTASTQTAAQHDTAKEKTGENTGQNLSNGEVSLSVIETLAREAKVLMSEHACQMIVATAQNREHAEDIAAEVIDIAKGTYPRENGWLVLDEDRTRRALLVSAIKLVPLFIDWLAHGEDKKIFTFLRRLHGQKQPIAEFMRTVVTELDNAHQARLEGAVDSVDPYTVDALLGVDTAHLEQMIGMLLRGVDERYNESYTSARLALVRALDMVRKSELEKSGDAYSAETTAKASERIQ